VRASGWRGRTGHRPGPPRTSRATRIRRRVPMRSRRGSYRAMAAAARRAASGRRHRPRPMPPPVRSTARRGGRVPSLGGRRPRAPTASATRPPEWRWRHGHRLDLDVGAPLISVDLQEHVADAQGRAFVVGDDDLDLLHVGQYRGDDHRLSPGFIAWGYMARTAMPG